MRRGGVISQRRRKRERWRVIRRRAMIAGGVLLVCALAMTPDLREHIANLAKDSAKAVQTIAIAGEKGVESVEITLPERSVYALQLGVYDSGERAKAQQMELVHSGVPCIVWQREKMRIVCAVANAREALDQSAAGGREAYVITDRMPEVRLRVSCTPEECEAAGTFVRLADHLLDELLTPDGRTLAELTAQARLQARDALDAHPEHLLYTQLAQSLINWCDLMENESGGMPKRGYAAAAMYTICREWRAALISGYSASEESTASAQRTPSTAAEVMPPA